MKKIWNYGFMYFLIGLNVLARAGGAGGRSKSSGSSKSFSSSSGSTSNSYTVSSSSSSSYTSSDSNDLEKLIFIFVGIIVISTIVDYFKTPEKEEKKPSKLDKLKAQLKNFDEEAFLKKVKETFYRVQKAWENQELKSVRNLISDGVYQKFSTQIMMMKKLKQKNLIEIIQVKYMEIIGIEFDGEYEIIHTLIKCKINEKFISELNPSLNEDIDESFYEYWSFIRKKDNKEVDLLEIDFCPNCGVKLEEVHNIEIAKCEYCNSILNTGEYDWILSEITQNSGDIFRGINRRKELSGKFQDLFGRDVDFSKQLVEDKVSNGLVQIDKAIALDKIYLAKRFVTDEVYERIKKIDKDYIFNRYYTTDSSLSLINEDGENYYIEVSVKREYERVRLSGDKVEAIDEEIQEKEAIIKLKKSKDISEKKGSIFANQCSVCGGGLEDTIDTHCPYCGELIADPRYDWIIYEITGLIV